MNDLHINNIQANNIANNLRFLLAKHRISESKLAKELKVPPITVRRLVSGETNDPKISTLTLFANYFKITLDDLINGENMGIVGLSQKEVPQLVPVLDWETASKIHSIHELNLELWEEWQPIMLVGQSPLSKETYCLCSRPSMQPRFPLGSLFVIDPKEEPIDGDTILVRFNQNNELSLRELVIDPPKWQLHPVIAGSESFFYDDKVHTIVGVLVLTLFSRKNKVI